MGAKVGIISETSKLFQYYFCFYAKFCLLCLSDGYEKRAFILEIVRYYFGKLLLQYGKTIPTASGKPMTYELGKTIPTNSENYGRFTYHLGKLLPTNPENQYLPSRQTYTYELGKQPPTNSENFLP